METKQFWTAVCLLVALAATFGGHLQWGPQHPWHGVVLIGAGVALVAVTFALHWHARFRWPGISLAFASSVGLLYFVVFCFVSLVSREEVLAELRIPALKRHVVLATPGCFPPDCSEADGEPLLNVYAQSFSDPWTTRIAQLRQCHFESVTQVSGGIRITGFGNGCARPVVVGVQ